MADLARGLRLGELLVAAAASEETLPGGGEAESETSGSASSSSRSSTQMRARLLSKTEKIKGLIRPAVLRGFVVFNWSRKINTIYLVYQNYSII